MEDLTLGEVASWIGLISLLIVSFWNIFDWKKRKKEGTYEIVPKDPWWKQTYIWQVFFRRALYRPISTTFAWIIFIIPAMVMVLIYSMGFFKGHPLKLEEMHQVSGIVTKVNRRKGRGSYDYIKVKDDNGNEKTYRLCCFYYDEEAEEFRQKIQDTKKRIDIWYEKDRFLWEKFNRIAEFKVDNEYITLQGNDSIGRYNYEYSVEFYNSLVSRIIWWIGYSLFGWVWIWFLNRKELPIHRLNKQKRYEKYNLKDE